MHGNTQTDDCLAVIEEYGEDGSCNEQAEEPIYDPIAGRIEYLHKFSEGFIF